jgi:hypothetical protein
MSPSLQELVNPTFQMICIELADNVKQEFVVELDNYADAVGCASAS